MFQCYCSDLSNQFQQLVLTCSTLRGLYRSLFHLLNICINYWVKLWGTEVIHHQQLMTTESSGSGSIWTKLNLMRANKSKLNPDKTKVQLLNDKAN